MTTLTLTEILPGDPREWSPRDKPNVKNYSYKVKAEDGTVYEISTKGDPPKLGPDEFKVTPPKEGTNFPPKLSRVFSGGGKSDPHKEAYWKGREERDIVSQRRQGRAHAQEMGIRWLAFLCRNDTREVGEDELLRYIDWFDQDTLSKGDVGLGGGNAGGASSVSSVQPAASQAAAESSAADSNRKRATSTRLTKAGIPHRETQQAIVRAFCGETATVAGLDAIDAALANRDWHVLFDEQGIPRPAELPDTSDLPSVA